MIVMVIAMVSDGDSDGDSDDDGDGDGCPVWARTQLRQVHVACVDGGLARRRKMRFLVVRFLAPRWKSSKENMVPIE